MRDLKSRVVFSGPQIVPVAGLRELRILSVIPLSIPELVPGTLSPGHVLSIGS